MTATNKAAPETEQTASVVWLPGDRVKKSGYLGTVQRHYGNGMYEVRLERGTVCVDGRDLVSAE